MSRQLTVGLDGVMGGFWILHSDDDIHEPPVQGLPLAARGLGADIEAWQAYLEQHWSARHGWDDGTRWWYAQEAARLQRELERVLRPEYRVDVSPWPATTQLTVMNEYMSDWPVWERGGLSDTGPDDEMFAVLSDELRAALHAWAEYFCENFHETRGWRRSSAGFHEEGERLRKELARQLGPNFEVGLSDWTR